MKSTWYALVHLQHNFREHTRTYPGRPEERTQAGRGGTTRLLASAGKRMGDVTTPLILAHQIGFTSPMALMVHTCSTSQLGVGTWEGEYIERPAGKQIQPTHTDIPVPTPRNSERATICSDMATNRVQGHLRCQAMLLPLGYRGNNREQSKNVKGLPDGKLLCAHFSCCLHNQGYNVFGVKKLDLMARLKYKFAEYLVQDCEASPSSVSTC